MQQKHRRLAGCVPIKGDIDQCSGACECDPLLLLISSRGNPSRLVFPKGGVKRTETPEQAALREAWEEAGIRGVVLGRISYLAPGSADEYDNDATFCFDVDSDVEDPTVHRNSELSKEHCRWFVMRVDAEDGQYPECGQRTKHWMKLSTALTLTNIRENTRKLLIKLDELLKAASNSSSGSSSGNSSSGNRN